MVRKIVNFAILVIGIGLIISLSRDISRLLKAGGRVRQAEIRVEELKKRQIELEKQKKYYQSDEFIEQQARDKLNYSRPGEMVVVLPTLTESFVDQGNEAGSQKLANWQQWWRLFF